MKQGLLNDLTELPVSHDPDIKKRVMFKNGDIPHITQYSQATLLPGQVAHAHAHKDMYEVFFCISGYGIITINGEIYKLLPGAFILCEPEELHEITNNGNEPLILNQLGIVA